MNVETLNRGLDRIEGKLSQLPELAERVLNLEQRSAGPGIIERTGRGRTFGQMAFEQVQENMDLLQKTRSLRFELRAASDPLSTANGRRIVSGSAGAPDGRILGLQYGLPQTPTNASAIEYSRYTATTGAAAQQAAEGDAKAAVRPEHTLITQTAITVAGWTKMSRQSMKDATALARAVDVTLRRSVDTALDAALVNGATGFTGGIEGLATAYTSLVYDTLVDATSEGVSTMQTAGFNPNVVALNPADWLAITVAKGTSNDHYLSGSYLGPLPEGLRGLRVVLSPSVDAGKSLLMDTGHIALEICDGFAIEMAYDSDDFTRNLVTVLGETRVIPVFLSVGAARLITPA